MAAGKYSFSLEQGVTLSRLIQWLDSTGTPIPLTGYTARMQIRSTIESDTVILSITSTYSENGVLTIAEATGKILIYIPASVTATFTSHRMVYDLEIVNTDTGEVIRLLEGKIKLSEEVTRWV